MSDISLTFPPWITAWFLLGQAAPFTTAVMVGLIAAAFLIGRTSGRGRTPHWLTWTLVIVGGLWFGGVSFWAFGFLDQIKTNIYRARHHYRLDQAAVMAGIEVPKGSWVSVDEKGLLYEIETAGDSVVSIDDAIWRGEIYLMLLPNRAATDHGKVKRATLAGNVVFQGIPCRAEALVEFSEFGGGLEHCTLSRRTSITADIRDDNGREGLKDLVCAADEEVMLRPLYRGLLERCVLAETAMVGKFACAGGKEILLAGDGLDSCTLAAAQPVGPFDLTAGALVKFTRGRLAHFELSGTSNPLSLSGLILPAGTVVELCDESGEISWLDVPDDRYVTIEGLKITGRINFDRGSFRSGLLFEDTSLSGRRLPRHAVVSSDDMIRPSSR